VFIRVNPWPGFCLGLLTAILQAQTSELRIEVRDPSGVPITATGRLENRPFETDSEGVATFRGLPYANYRIQIAKPGFAAQTFELTVDAPSITRTITLLIRPTSYRIDVSGATPLPGINRALEEIPSPVQSAIERDWLSAGIPSVPDFLNQRLNGIYWNEVQGNPFQPDVNYRGYTASPLLGTPQGLSVYMDGVRLNQPFGDIVSWDLIPRIAIAEMTLVPGSNPIYGLNTLGGALSLHTKSGQDFRQTVLQIGGGSFARKTADFEHGQMLTRSIDVYAAGSLFFEDGWREDSPSNVRQFFGKIGYRRDRTAVRLTTSYANNSLNGNGLQEFGFLDRDYRSVYTRPDINTHRSPFANVALQHTVTNSLLLSANAYYRYISSTAFNGDINEESLDQALYQPNAAERAALAAAGYTGFPTSGENASNTPFPYWRCIAQVLLLDEPSEKCNGLINRGNSAQHNYGAYGQLSWFGAIKNHRNQLTAGAGYDRSNARFSQSTQLGYLNPDRSVTGLNAYADGITGGDADGEPYDNRVNLSGRIHTVSVYATDTLTFASNTHLTLSGRYNRTNIDNADRIRPTAGPGSLTGKHTFQRFNPSAGITTRTFRSTTTYFNYAEGSRAPTSIELGCADPNTPCKLPNAMAGDPPLKQVVTRTLEAGIRSSNEGGVTWSGGWFHAANRDDILFVASQQTGYGYFRNFGRTRRQGLQFDAATRVNRVQLGGGYTFLDATFQSSEFVNGQANSEGADPIEPGARIPLVPRHMFKSFANVEVTKRLNFNLNLLALSSLYARGNENNLHQTEHPYFIGEGTSHAYAVLNAAARFQVQRHIELTFRVDNILNRQYQSAAQLGPTGFTDQGNFIARPFPAENGEFPVRNSTFYAPGAPRAAWIGLRLSF